MSSSGSTLAATALGHPVTVQAIEGDRVFRRRLLEMGLVPGTRVTPVGVAPLGDPIEIEVRESRLSIRRYEASRVVVGDD